MPAYHGDPSIFPMDVYRPKAVERFEKLFPKIKAYHEAATKGAAKGDSRRY